MKLLSRRSNILFLGCFDILAVNCTNCITQQRFLAKTFWGVGSAAVEQSRRKFNVVAQGDE